MSYLTSRDSWNKQKGKGKDQAKADYVAALLKVRTALFNAPELA